MNRLDSLSLKRPTHRPEHWLPEVMAWLPLPYTWYVDEAEKLMAIAHAVGPSYGDTLFCCHLDTVHPQAGDQAVVAQNVADPERGRRTVSDYTWRALVIAGGYSAKLQLLPRRLVPSLLVGTF